jgi:phosphoribosylaminoimidazolecarboxamide formyltransferase/IMP cyclohydrolase
LKNLKTAILSVYNKEGIKEFAACLVEDGWNIVSTGGTAAFLRKNGIEVTDVSQITGFPECLDGRVKTLHPALHAGILARRSDSAHLKTLLELGVNAVDLVCVQLYPFVEKTGAGISFEEATEFIDIGGPAMLRAAAKNARDVIVICDTADYAPVIQGLRSGGLDEKTRMRLAAKTFKLISSYDAAISQYFERQINDETALPAWTPRLSGYSKYYPLRYGENSHQNAALYLREDGAGALGAMEQLCGKPLSYNNIRDMDAAWKCVCAFGLPQEGIAPLGSEEVRRLIPEIDDSPRPCCVAVKHNTPCGAALGDSALEAFVKARDCDAESIFGGVLAFNTPLSANAAKIISALFLEVIAAPDFEAGALEILGAKKNLRLVKLRHAPQENFELSSVDGGILAQQPQRRLLEEWRPVTKTALDPQLAPQLIFALRVVNFVKSNAIVCARDFMAAGIGGGQTSRISAAKLAFEKAKKMPAAKNRRLVLASDAFFPFADVVEGAAAAGVAAIVQPGGSDGDKNSIEACNRHQIPMVFTGLRYFKH